MTGQAPAVDYPRLPELAAVTRDEQTAAIEAIWAGHDFKRHRAQQLVALRVALKIGFSTGWAFPSQDFLARTMGLSKITVQRALRSLCGDGVEGDSHMPKLSRAYLHREQGKSSGGRPLDFYCLVKVDGIASDRAGAGKLAGQGPGSTPGRGREQSADRREAHRAGGRKQPGQGAPAPISGTDVERQWNGQVPEIEPGASSATAEAASGLRPSASPALPTVEDVLADMKASLGRQLDGSILMPDMVGLRAALARRDAERRAA